MKTRSLLALLSVLCLGGCEREQPPRSTNTPPDITLESPTQGQVVRAGQGLQLTARVEDAEEGPALGERVVWVASGSGQLARGASATVTFPAPGEQTLTATVIDSGGLVASASLTLQVLDALAPRVVIRQPASGSAWNLGQLVPLDCEALSVTGELLPDSAIQWTSTLSGPLRSGARSQAMLGVAGEDTLTCTAIDPGTGARASAHVPITVRSTQAPTVRLLRPEAELYVKAGQPAPYSPTVFFRATAHDFNAPSEGEALSAAIEWTLEPGGTRLGTGEAVTYTFTTPGEHTVVATVTDSRGNQARDSVHVHLVTNLPPQCDIFWPRQDGARLLQGAPSELEAWCVDPETGQEPSPTWRTTAAFEPLGEGKNLDVVLSAPGAQELSACAKDPENPALKGCARRPVRVVTNSAPGDCAIQTPLAHTEVNAGVDLVLRGSATDAEDPQLDLRYKWSSNRDGVLAQGANAITRQLSTPGPHTLTLTVTDPWGLTCAASISLEVNGAPVVGISKVEQGETNCLQSPCREGTPLIATGSASDTPEGLDGLEWLDSLVDDFGGTTSDSPPSPTAGKHTLVLRATDRVGAVGRAAVSFAVLPSDRTRLIEPLVDNASPVTALAFSPGVVHSVDGKTASVLGVRLPPGSGTTSVPLRSSGLALFSLGTTSGGFILFVGTSEGVERCTGTTCTRYRGGALSSSSEAVRAIAALESPDLLLLGTDKGLVLTRASNPSAGGPPGTIVGRRVLPGTAVRQIAVSPASTARELKLWAATAEGLAELTLTVETPFEPAVALVTSVLHGPPALPDKDVRAVTVSPEGLAYAGTLRGWGALGQPGPSLKTPPWSFPDEEVQALVFERTLVGGQVRELLWAGTRRGLIRYDLGRDIATRFGTEDGLPGEDVRALTRAPDGTRYLGTAAGPAVYSGP
jgi:PKD repeat protein